MLLKKASVILFIFVLILSGCTNNYKGIKNHDWLYGEGYCIGDLLVFTDSTRTISHDTIYLYGKPQAVILYIGGGVVGDVEMKIKSLNSNETGIYHKK